MALPHYRGFSTASYLTNKTFSLTNQELVKQDLLNHIYTIPGERVHLPDFGTRIPLLVFEQLDQHTIGIIEEDLRKVFNYDPRVKLIDMSISAVPALNAIVGFVDVLYVELKTSETIRLEFKSN